MTLPPYSPELQPVERLWKLTDATLVQRFVNQDSFIPGERIGDVAWNLS